MAASPILRFNLKISALGCFVDLTTVVKEHKDIKISPQLIAGVIAILNGRSATFNEENTTFSCVGGVSRDVADQMILALHRKDPDEEIVLGNLVNVKKNFIQPTNPNQ